MIPKLQHLNRRKFLLTSGAFTAAVCSSPWNLASAQGATPARARHKFTLNGGWELNQAGTKDWLPATVPGCAHTDLMAAGKIPDPFFQDNERLVQWVGEANWTYRRRFEAPRELFQHDRLLLRCEGLDTLAVVRLNGHELGRPDNMFRVWEFDAKPLLQPGSNTVEISFSSPMPYIKERQAGRALFEWAGPKEPRGRAWVRKEPCNFGWDWAPVLITCGIWRDIGLLAFDLARIEDVRIRQDHSVAGQVTLEIEVDARADGATPLNAGITVSQGGQSLYIGTAALSEGSATATVEIRNPKLWWPSGMGGQPLYEVSVELRDDDGNALDQTSRRIGLRTLNLLPPEGKKSLRFEANGVVFFAKGANLVPADAFATRITTEQLRRLARDAAAVNMNSLRFWGGGYYEDGALFDACDELGLCVWLDFKFACSSYPAFDAAFLDNVKHEAGEQLRRLRHHPCIALWCGNNEISLMTKDEWSDQSMGRQDYDKLFKELLGGLVADLAPQANYVSGSPDCGDVHNWKVWHGGAPFEDYRTLTGFMSEFGFQSFAGPQTVRAYTAPADRKSIQSPAMQWHERSGTNGLDIIFEMLPKYFQTPKDFEATLWSSQILQGWGIKIGAEHWRRTMPESMGCLFWQYNDCWPGTSWSSVDYYGRWKALHYFARRFYSPLLVSALENPLDGSVAIHVSSDRMEPCAGKLTWNATDVSGRSLLKGVMNTEIAPHQSRLLTTLQLDPLIHKHGAANILVWIELAFGDGVVSNNLALFVAPKLLPLADPRLKTSVKKKDESFLVTISAKRPALWCWLDLPQQDAAYSDNFVHVTPERHVEILVTPRAQMSEAGFKSALRVRSVFDLHA